MMYSGAPDVENDGVTHINIYSKGRTVVGRLLSNFQPSPFHSSKYGFFMSIEGFWYWLATGKQHEEFRLLWGFEAKQTGREFPRKEDENFREEIMLAIREKVMQNEAIKKELIASTLPFAHYYAYGKDDNVTYHEIPQFFWLVHFIDSLRTELQST